MASYYFLLVVMVASIILHLACADAAGTAYDVLEKNNLPRGLLPNGVQSYTLSPDGKFVVTLAGQCDFPINVGGQEFKFRFANTVGGVIKAGSIHEVYGVRVQVKFGWLGLRQVDRAGDQITLQAQQFTQSFPVSAFAVSASCS